MALRPSAPRAPVVLLGAGHAHLHVIRRARSLTASGAEVVVVDPGDFFYSGSAAAVLAGLYPRGANRVDLAALASAHGVRRIRDRVVAAEPEARRVRLASGSTLDYEVLSVNVGSAPARRTRGAEEHAVGVKPVPGLLELASFVEDAGERDSRAALVVVGGGASGCEAALALEARAEREGARVDVTLVTLGEVLEGWTPGARSAMRRVLEGRRVRLLEHARVERVEADGVILGDGRRLPSDVTVDATGLAPAPVVARLGLATGPDGGLRVDRHLRSVDDPRVFGAGDCIHFEDAPLPKVGVHAVRQAPVLLRNLKRTLEGGTDGLDTFRPRSTYLLVLSLGDGRGLAVRNGLHWTGRLAWWLKDFLDRRFLSRYRREGASGRGGAGGTRTPDGGPS